LSKLISILLEFFEVSEILLFLFKKKSIKKND